MERILGKKLCGGIAIGPIHFLDGEKACTCSEVLDPDRELSRFESACTEAKAQLNKLQIKAQHEAGEEAAEIFEIHAMLLEDDDFCDAVRQNITQKHWDAAYAAQQAGESIAADFLAMDNEYFRARSADIRDVAARVAGVLQGKRPEQQSVPGIVAAEELTPSQTIQMDATQLLGFVTRQGSPSSHTAILARSMAIPAIAGVAVNPEWEGKTAILDGNEGLLLLNPDEQTLTMYQSRAAVQKAEKAQLKALIGQENVSRSGRIIKIFANAGSLADIALAQQNDAGGIGLFRTEFLYLDAPALPDEQQQFAVYKRALLAMPGKRIVFRTMDIGADKQVSYLDLGQEANPALGCRAVRYCLSHQEVFRTQLRALYRASAYGKLSIMYPMITSAEELDEIYAVSASVREELRRAGTAFDETVPEGIMIETPAAAVISDLLAKKADFFSIGTNDLTQYTLAVDRQNPNLGSFYQPHHEAILRLIRMTVENAHKAGKPVGICGELGADISLTEAFLDMGVDELSVAPLSVLKIRKAVRQAL
ncbi:MAG: phosphoenolpyruvate--protein phosphotransferase [Faecalibacterium sp.]|jgi:phosphotransferase system enzyme I (PtsI)|nr:phosphoenolpyruvate--protein phosphotransferase [Faecalibacterium sp.]